jgi:hypothetical protein
MTYVNIVSDGRMTENIVFEKVSPKFMVAF